MSVALLAFILANTLLGGKLTSFLTETAGDGGSNWLMFSAAWGSNRGATWSAGARCFWEADLLHKIFGVGPDCMYAFLSNEASPELQNMVYDFFYGNRLTNAHNEWLTILVDIGVLGLVSYAGMMISVIRNFLHAGKKSMLVGACGFCVLAYTVNNMFSFQQVMNISTVFVIMGIEGICGVQPVIEPAKVEFMVSASVGPGRGPPDLVGSPLRFGRLKAEVHWTS